MIKVTYHPDRDSLVLQFADDPWRTLDEALGQPKVNVTHLVLATLDDNGRIHGFSIRKASRQFRNTDLASSTPEVTWRVPALGISVALTGGSGNGTGPADKLTISYFPDSDTLDLNFTDGPADIVVDITNCDTANINEDGTLNSIPLAFAQELLQVDDATTYIPDFQWKIQQPKQAPTPAPVATT